MAVSQSECSAKTRLKPRIGSLSTYVSNRIMRCRRRVSCRLSIAWRRYRTRPILGVGKDAIARLIPYAAERNWPRASSELIVGGIALLTLLIAQWLLSTAIHGANYYGFDGKMAQATILAG